MTKSNSGARSRRVIPAQAGIQNRPDMLDPGLRRDDESGLAPQDEKESFQL